MGGRKQFCGYGTSFEAKRWLSLDTCGILGISISAGIHIYSLGVIWLKLLTALVPTIVFYTCYIPAFLLALVSLFMASTTDPGAVPLGARPLVTLRRGSSIEDADSTARRGMRRCNKCRDNYKPPRAHHDSVTGRCIIKFDHYCPWINNAVGALNHKFFSLFLFYTASTCLLSILLLFLQMIQCGYVYSDEDENADINNSGDSEAPGRDLQAKYVHAECNDFFGNHLLISLTIVSVVFFVFTIVMGCEQLEAIETGQSKIARMKMRVGQAGTEFATVTQEFNEMFGGSTTSMALHWFLPTPVRFPTSMKKVVLAYEWDPTNTVPYQEEENNQELTVVQEGHFVNSGKINRSPVVSRSNSISSAGNIV
jgi:hypothetical protein